MKLRHLFIYCLVFGLINGLIGQSEDCLEIYIEHYGEQLDLPFAGGLNAPQINQMDVDLDGNPDLVIFERKTQLISVYLFEEGKYKFDCASSDLFPTVSSWMLIRDFNLDGIGDIFTSPELSSQSYIEVWKGTIKNGKLSFEKIFFENGPGDYLYYNYFGQDYGIYVAKVDFPAITDLDVDGDLDILSFESGGGTVNYFRNLTVDENLDAETLKFTLEDRCWGKFRESPVSEEIILSDDPENCAEGGGFRHAGSTISTLDFDSDNDYDLLLGDTEYAGLIFIDNGGDANQAFATGMERDFPQSDIPIDMDWFLGTFLVDTDLDGKEELLVAPNEVNGSRNYENILLYKNQSDSEIMDFRFERNDFLVGEMVDWGSDIIPLFIDIDQDGLEDMLLGMSGLVEDHEQSEARLIYYRNTGTKNDPILSLEDEDFLGFSSKESRFLAPASGDMDGDGDIDLIVGKLDGSISYFENLAGEGEIAFFGPELIDYFSIDVGDKAMPLILDADQDNDPDLLISFENSLNQDGQYSSAVLFINSGSADHPDFEAAIFHPSNNAFWLPKSYIENPFNLRSKARPYYFESGNKRYLMVGSELGELDLFEIGENGELSLKEESFKGLDFGGFCAPALLDINTDDYLELLIGTSTGGLRLLRTKLERKTTNTGDLKETISEISIYPNPANEYVRIKAASKDHTIDDIRIFSSLGQEVNFINRFEHSKELDLSGLANGIYMFRIKIGESIHWKQLVKNNR